MTTEPTVEQLRERWRTEAGTRHWERLRDLGVSRADAEVHELVALQRDFPFAAGLVSGEEGGPLVDLRGVDGTDARLAGTSFFRCDVSFASFDRADLSETSWQEAVAAQTSFRGVEFGTRSDFMSLRAHGADFRGARLSNASFHDSSVVDADFRESQLDSVGFTQADLRGANFLGSTIRRVTFDSPGGFVAPWAPRTLRDGYAFLQALGRTDGLPTLVLGACQAFPTRGAHALPPFLFAPRAPAGPSEGFLCAPPDDPRLNSWLGGRGWTYQRYVQALLRDGIRVEPESSGFMLRGLADEYIHDSYTLLGHYIAKGRGEAERWKPLRHGGLTGSLNARLGANVFTHPALDAGLAEVREAIVPDVLLPICVWQAGQWTIVDTVNEWRELYLARGIDWDALYPGLGARR